MVRNALVVRHPTLFKVKEKLKQSENHFFQANLALIFMKKKNKSEARLFNQLLKLI